MAAFFAVYCGKIALEIMRFDRAALGHVFRIEIQHYPLATEILQADSLAFLGLESEIGCLAAFRRQLGSAHKRSLCAEEKS